MMPKTVFTGTAMSVSWSVIQKAAPNAGRRRAAITGSSPSPNVRQKTITTGSTSSKAR